MVYGSLLLILCRRQHVPGGILRKNVHRVVDLNIHVVADIGQLLSLVRDDFLGL